MSAASTRARVVEQLAASIAGLRPGHPARVAIDGVDGAGKTTLPGQRLHLAQCRPLERADVVFDNTALDHPKVTLRARR